MFYRCPKSRAWLNCSPGRPLSFSAIGHFHEYLVRGEFPQTARVESIAAGQRIVREDCIGKAISRDIAFQFGVRRVSELEYASLHLCTQDDVLLDLVALCEKLQIKRPTGEHLLDLFEAAQLIHRVAPYVMARKFNAPGSRSTWPMPAWLRRFC